MTSPSPRPSRAAPFLGSGPRRPWRVAAGVGGGLALAGAAAVPGVAWYFSGVALTVTESGAATTSVRAGSEDGRGGPVTAVLSTEGQGGASAAALGLHGVRWDGGWGIVGEIVDEGPGAGAQAGTEVVTRTWRDVDGELPAGPVDGVVFQDVYDGDPASRGLGFEDVVVTSDVGELPAWLVPGRLAAGGGEAAGVPAAATGITTGTGTATATGADWVIFVHGWGGSRRESLRYLPTFHDLGWTTLVPTYRNDEEAPPDPSGRYRLGESEWRDLDAALAYARANGAERVVLAGWSMGGAIALQALDRSDHADVVVGLVLNAPVLDWRGTFRHQGSLAGLPQWWSDVAITVIERRARLDVDDYDWVTRAGELDVPVYLVHSTADSFVPADSSVALAEARPDLVTFRPDGPADHTREWNVDPAGYEADLRDWLASTLPT